jgi:hypothetical protein
MYNSRVDNKPKETAKPKAGRMHPLVPVFIVAAVICLALVLVALARAPHKRSARFEAPPVLKPVNPADEDAIRIFKLALESQQPQTVIQASSRMKYLAIPELKDSMLKLKERGLLWDYIGALPELHYAGYDKAIEDLNGYLASADLQTVVTALDALKRMPPLSCRDELLACLKQPHTDMAYGGTKVLQAWHKSDNEINDVLVNIMNVAPIASSRIFAASTLYMLGAHKEDAWKVIRRMSENASMDMAPALVEFLKDCGDPRAPETIALMLKSDNTRAVALAGLVNLRWKGKDKALAEWDGKVQQIEQFLIYVNLEAEGKKTKLGEYLATAAPNNQAEQEKIAEDSSRPGSHEKPNEAQKIMQLTSIINSMKGWNDPRVIPYMEQMAEGAPRVVRMEISRVMRKFASNKRAMALAYRLLESAKDDGELREHAMTLGFIDNGRHIARLYELMLNSADEQTKLTFAWAILNINRGHSAAYEKM